MYANAIFFIVISSVKLHCFLIRVENLIVSTYFVFCFCFGRPRLLYPKEHVCGSLKFAILPLLLDNILALATRSSLNIRGLCVCACVRACF